METENEIGRVLARLRRENGFSQERLALLLGVTRQVVSKWECGMARPSVENLYRISEVYDIPIRELTVLLEPEAETGPDADAEPEISAPVPEPEADTGPAVAPPKQRRRWSRRKKTITALAVLLLLAAGLLAIRAWTWQRKNDVMQMEEMEQADVNDLIIVFGKFD